MSATQKISIGERFKYTRTCRGLSQVELAKIMHVNQKTISNLDRNIGFNSALVVKAAIALDIDVNWLKHGVGEVPDFTTMLVRTRQRKSPTPGFATDMRKQITKLSDEVQELKDMVKTLLDQQNQFIQLYILETEK